MILCYSCVKLNYICKHKKNELQTDVIIVNTYALHEVYLIYIQCIIIFKLNTIFKYLTVISEQITDCEHQETKA